MYRLGASLNVERQSGFRDLLFYRFDEGGNIFVAGSFRLVQLLLYIIIRFPLGVLQ